MLRVKPYQTAKVKMHPTEEQKGALYVYRVNEDTSITVLLLIENIQWKAP